MLTFKVTGIEEAKKLVDPAVVRQATTRTLNEVGRKARTSTIKSITQSYNIKRADLSETSTGKGRVKLFAATRGKNEVVVEVSGRPISLAYFGARQTVGNRVITAKKGHTTKRKAKFQGVQVEVVRGKKTRLGKSFIAVVRAGNSGFHTGVFTRARKGRFPIMEKKMVTVASMFNNSKAEEAIGKLVKDEFGPIFFRNLEWYSSR